MNINKIRQLLFDVGSEVSNVVHNVNCGGCGVYAFELHKRLLRNGINSKIVVYHSNNPWELPPLYSNIEKIQSHLITNNVPLSKTWRWCEETNFGGFGHIKLEFANAVWDVYGSVPNSKSKIWNEFYSKMDGYLAPEVLEKVIKYQENWNTRFNRKDIPKMRRIMDRIFRANGLQ